MHPELLRYMRILVSKESFNSIIKLLLQLVTVLWPYISFAGQVFSLSPTEESLFHPGVSLNACAGLIEKLICERVLLSLIMTH